MKTENFALEFEDDAIREIAALAAEVNESVENIGARRLHTILEKLLEDVSFTAAERQGESETITVQTVHEKVGVLAEKSDLSKFIL